MRIQVPRYNLFTPASKSASLTKSHNKSKDTKAELLLRRYLWKLGLRYRLHVKSLHGKPDLVFISAKIAIFCDGDFWHGRNWEKLKKELRNRRNAKYWIPKIQANIYRDALQTKKLRQMGWLIVRLWETDILKKPAVMAEKIHKILKRRKIKDQ
jgi:DNA mismatch endonuclease (patch repair protein)